MVVGGKGTGRWHHDLILRQHCRGSCPQLVCQRTSLERLVPQLFHPLLVQIHLCFIRLSLLRTRSKSAAEGGTEDLGEETLLLELVFFPGYNGEDFAFVRFAPVTALFPMLAFRRQQCFAVQIRVRARVSTRWLQVALRAAHFSSLLGLCAVRLALHFPRSHLDILIGSIFILRWILDSHLEFSLTGSEHGGLLRLLLDLIPSNDLSSRLLRLQSSFLLFLVSFDRPRQS